MLILNGELPPTATHPYRRWYAVHLPGMSYPKLTIEGGKSPERITATEGYDLEEDTAEHPPCRTFFLRKRDGVTYYRVTVGPDPSCSCESFRARRQCKHLESIAAMVGQLSTEKSSEGT